MAHLVFRAGRRLLRERLAIARGVKETAPMGYLPLLRGALLLVTVANRDFPGTVAIRPGWCPVLCG